MPITDPTFQHSDEDWTQITQPRLRKRVQNRSKIRQQRADSIEEGLISSTPAGVPRLSRHGGSTSSNGSSSVGGQYDTRNDYTSSRDHYSAPNLSNQSSNLHGLEYASPNPPGYSDAQTPWLDYPSSGYPVSSSYALESSPVVSSQPRGRYMYDSSTPAASTSRFAPYPVTTPTLSLDTGVTATASSQYDLSPDYSYASPVSISPGSYTIAANPRGLPYEEQGDHQSFNIWDVPATHDTISSFDSSQANPARTKHSMHSGNGYYASQPVSLAYTAASFATTTSSTSAFNGQPSPYPGQVGTPFGDGIEPRGSGINPSVYKSHKKARAPSVPRQQKMNHHRHH
ncbi:MAG: hypothetical protein Q9222_006361 [Ikaeria aurantiellina]